MLQPNYIQTDTLKAQSLPEATSLASAALYQITTNSAYSITNAIGSMFTGALNGKSVATQGMSGPIEVIRMGSQVVSSNDVSAAIAFAAAISVNLAVVNSLPLPALDGGQMVFVLSEAVLGKKVDQRLQEEINAFAFFFLLIVAAGTAIGDVGSIISK